MRILTDNVTIERGGKEAEHKDIDEEDIKVEERDMEYTGKRGDMTVQINQSNPAESN